MSAGPTLSVIIPVFNGVGFLPHSLPPLLAMLRRGELTEVFVIDDGSTDGSAALAESMGARVIPSGGRLGPGGARNQAARLAMGDVLWFVDADVVAHEDAARELWRAFAEPEIVAVFGALDDRPRAPNFLSQYKNLVHHFYHRRAIAEASTFWAGCGGVRRDSFLACGGFDEARYPGPSIEDIELGYRLKAAGGRILRWPALSGTHLKVWRLGNLFHAEIFSRAIPWSRLILAHGGVVNELNVSVGERVRALLAGVFILGCVASLHPAVPGWIALVVLATIAVANAALVRLFARRRGSLFALGGLLFHQLYYLYSGAAFGWCWLEHRVRRPAAP